MISAKNEKKRRASRLRTLVCGLALTAFGANDASAVDFFSYNIPISRIFNPLFQGSQEDFSPPPSPENGANDPIPASGPIPIPNLDVAPSPKRAADPNDPNYVGPRFSSRLPHCVVLGKVVCESNFPLDSVDGLQAEIVQLQRDLVEYLGVPEATETISLCLFRDVGSYLDFVGTEFPQAPLDRPALYVKASGPGVLMIPRDDRMLVNIRHEMTHAYLNAALRHVPIWLDEGLAKYFETPPGDRGFENPFLQVAEKNANGFFSSPPSLERLEKLTRVDQMRSREYRESWSWVHFMIHYSNDTHRALGVYLRSLRPELQAGISQKEAFKLQKKAPMKRLLDKHIPGYEKKYVEHFRAWDERKAAYENARAEARRREAERAETR